METTKKYISVEQFEAKVFELDGIVIRVRAKSNSLVEDYTFQRKVSDDQTVSDWLKARIIPCIQDLECSVIGGNFSNVVGQTSVGYLRNSYKRH